MAVFHYPKTRHTRNLAPRKFKRYQTYKRYLQAEFARVCVYCRQPDTTAPNLNFGVDHYRPKGIKRFSSLTCDYTNLYYCCSECNSRKNNYWPQDEQTGPHVVAPCEHEMASHLRFDSSNGRVEARSRDGAFTEELLQLNSPDQVQFRITTLTTIKLYQAEIANNKKTLEMFAREMRKGRISKASFDAEAAALAVELDCLQRSLQHYTGELPLSPLPRVRQGVTLL